MAYATELSANMVRTKDLIGVDVKNNLKEDLGEIKEIILNKTDGHVCYVVLSFGGFLGLGDKLFALPWKAFSYNAAEDCFILNVDKEKLKNAPGFSKDNWPDMADKTWGAKIHDYYGIKSTL